MGPVGGDLGYFALSAREELDPLLEAYLTGLPPDLATPDQARLGARVVAVYTALSRAEWALARVAPGEGALAGKFSHPAVVAVPARAPAALPAGGGAALNRVVDAGSETYSASAAKVSHACTDPSS